MLQFTRMFSGNKKVFLFFFTLLFLCGLFAGVSPSYSSNPFLSKPAEVEKNTDKPSLQSSEKKELKKALLPQIMARITLLQMQMKQKISTHVRNFKENGKFTPLIPIFLLAFSYGAVHAAGPGHGKGIAMTYSLGKGRTFRSGFMLGSLIATVHAGSAILLVLLLQLILHQNVTTSLDSVTQKTQIVSYGLLTLIGAVLLIASLFEWFEKEEHSSSPGRMQKAGNNPLIAALAIGIIPCPGVIMILLFCLSLDQLILGILLGIAVSLGMALTITFAVWLSLAGKKTALAATSRWEKTFNFVEKFIHTFSALLLTSIGMLFLYTAVCG